MCACLSLSLHECARGCLCTIANTADVVVMVVVLCFIMVTSISPNNVASRTTCLLALFVSFVSFVLLVALEAVGCDKFGGSSGRSGTVPITLGITVENELAVR